MKSDLSTYPVFTQLFSKQTPDDDDDKIIINWFETVHYHTLYLLDINNFQENTRNYNKVTTLYNIGWFQL